MGETVSAGFPADEMILEALKAYGMADAACERVRHNENITCRVDHGASAYALRIHRPAEGFRASLAHGEMSGAELFRSEADLLAHMARNGFEGLQRPVPNPAGEYVVKLKNGAPAMMLTWVDGRPIAKEEGAKYAREIGRLACRIHRAARGFVGERIHYDRRLGDRMIGEIRRAASLNHIAQDAGRICIRELEAVKAVQMRLEALAAPSVIHADLGFDNILVTDGGLIPIDFSSSGYAPLAQEAGMLMSNYQDDDSVRALLTGFGDSGERVDTSDAEVFLSYSVLLFICAQHDRCFHDAWFEPAMRRWCETLFVH